MRARAAPASPVAQTTNDSPALFWLALALTPGLGPTRARRVVEHFGGIEAVFRASLTELEATGIQVVSAQALASGQSLELAQEELVRASAAAHTSFRSTVPPIPSSSARFMTRQ